MQIETDITDDLVQWGKWASACPSKCLSYPRSQPFTPIKAGVGLSITDDYALELDRAIAKLFSDDGEVMSMLHLKFIYGYSYREIEKRCGLSKTRAQRIINDSVKWLTGYLIAKREAA